MLNGTSQTLMMFTAKPSQISLKRRCNVSCISLDSCIRKQAGWSCRHDIDLEVSLASGQQSMSSHILRQLRAEADRLRQATPTISGALIGASALVSESCQSTTLDPFEMQLLCSPTVMQPVEGAASCRIAVCQ